MDITLTYSSLAEVVDRQLSIVGKRSTDENGKLLFADITLGSKEKSLIEDYIRQAVIDITTEMSAFVTAGSMTQVTLTFPTNHKPALETFIQQSCEAYCVSFALYSWFTVTAPRIADKYLGDCKRQLSAVIRLTNEKGAPQGSTQDIVSSTSTVIT